MMEPSVYQILKYKCQNYKSILQYKCQNYRSILYQCVLGVMALIAFLTAMFVISEIVGIVFYIFNIFDVKTQANCKDFWCYGLTCFENGAMAILLFLLCIGVLLTCIIVIGFVIYMLIECITKTYEWWNETKMEYMQIYGNPTNIANETTSLNHILERA